MIVTIAIVFGSSFIFMLVETFGSTRERRAIDLQGKGRFPLPREERLDGREKMAKAHEIHQFFLTCNN
jgi:hypothetical protein